MPSLSISHRVAALEPSATLAMAAKARELKAAGRSVCDFSVGEPDFATPAHICDAAARAMRAGQTHYTPSSGIPELRAAIAQTYRQRHGVEYAPQQVIVSNGAKHSLHNVFTALLNPGDEVIIPAPYWVSYAELVRLTGAVPVIVPTREEDDFKLSPAQFEAAITPRTKLFLICSPSNPTGSVYTPAELGELAEVVLARNLLAVSDEIYERLIYGDNRFASFAALRPGMAERVITVNGCSKAYAMTGWRIGWTLSPPALAKAMDNLQSQETSNPCSISQYAALAALEGPQDCVEEMLAEFAQRRAWVRDRIARLPGLSSSSMGGAFYAFVNIQQHLAGSPRGHNPERANNPERGRQGDKERGRTDAKRPATSAEWCLELLAQQGVATVMGSAFGAEGYMRASYAAAMPVLEEGFDRLEKFLN